MRARVIVGALVVGVIGVACKRDPASHAPTNRQGGDAEQPVGVLLVNQFGVFPDGVYDKLDRPNYEPTELGEALESRLVSGCYRTAVAKTAMLVPAGQVLVEVDLDDRGHAGHVAVTAFDAALGRCVQDLVGQWPGVVEPPGTELRQVRFVLDLVVGDVAIEKQASVRRWSEYQRRVRQHPPRAEDARVGDD